MDSRSRTEIRVLLVEDTATDVALLRAILSRNIEPSYNVTHCANYERACEVLRAETFDVLLLDYHLGDQPGLNILHFLKEANIHTPAVMLTGSKDDQIAQECLLAGAADFLSKDDLTARVLQQTIFHAQIRAEAQRKSA